MASVILRPEAAQAPGSATRHSDKTFSKTFTCSIQERPMVRSTALASLAILAAFTVAPLAARAETANVVGGGGATMTGGGDDMRISYNSSGAGGGSVLVQSGR